jgi:hypothetical protein
VKHLASGSAKEGTKTHTPHEAGLDMDTSRSQQVTDTLGTSGALSNTKK